MATDSHLWESQEAVGTVAIWVDSATQESTFNSVRLRLC